jgi:hypothetical protein
VALAVGKGKIAIRYTAAQQPSINFITSINY